MAGKPHLRRRDCKFLEMVGRYGYMTMEQVGKFYGTKYYHRHRIKMLEEYGYITRKRGIVQLGALGRELLGVERPVRLGNRQQLQRRIEQAELYLLFETLPHGWEWVPSFVLKEEQPGIFPNFCKFSGLLKTGGAEYLVYLLPARPRRKGIDSVKLELNRFYQINCRKAIVFCKSMLAMEEFGYSNLGYEELHLLPYPHGMQLLRFVDRRLVAELGRNLFGNIITGEHPQADFTIGKGGKKTDVWFLATNDTGRINFLENYLDIRWRGITGYRGTAILCLEQQEARYREMFPGVQIYTFNMDEVILLDKKVVGWAQKRE